MSKRIRKRAIEKARTSRTKTKFVRSKTKVNKSLYNNIYRQVKEANNRIIRLEKTYGKDSWGIKKLANLKTDNLNFITAKNRIRISKNMSDIELLSLSKSVKRFLELESSTISGVERIKKRQLSNIKRDLSDEDIEITNKEAEGLYQMFEDRDFTSVVKNYDIPPSDIWVDIMEAKEKNVTLDGWLDIMGRYINRESLKVDSDLRRSLEGLYNRYVIS